MDNNTAKKLFQDYINAATDLAESVKRNIIKDGVIDDKTVNKLNDYIIAMNKLANQADNDVDYEEMNDENETDPKLQ